ncbi:hypothetical protein JKG68_08695 [Microvirga aerilata]|uniref:Uncharacterized protein n=1 Tax=Microvirga aerilata TaxID=670292 RepID=A0A937CXI0_9HYPH|nr:hypothetical protein [Microvirga aerilata]MBL0404039.1 hypothetical protein [Microvirga aerilata]
MTLSSSSSAFRREKLTPERIAEMRGMVEGSTLSFRRIAASMSLTASTVSRYAAEGGWQRPSDPAGPAGVPAPAPPHAKARPALPTVQQRERITQKLWRLAERHAEELEDQPLEVAQRALQPLARLTRTLGEMDKHVQPPLDAGQYEIDTKPRRSLHEMRDELVAHLERIEREEREYEERYRWTFEDGAGI